MSKEEVEERPAGFWIHPKLMGAAGNRLEAVHSPAFRRRALEYRVVFRHDNQQRRLPSLASGADCARRHLAAKLGPIVARSIVAALAMAHEKQVRLVDPTKLPTRARAKSISAMRASSNQALADEQSLGRPGREKLLVAITANPFLFN